MCASSPSRIKRKQVPPRYYVAHRNYLRFLRLDFEDRCGYSGQHVQRVGGIGGMDIDHHNPLLPQPARNAYRNLLLASRHCNGKKGDRWPTKEMRDQGIRFLNPCEELDYGVHLFEDPDTFEIWGATPAGKFHVRMLDLNADHLVRERRNRHELRELQKKAQAVTMIADDRKSTLKGVRAFLDEVAQMIPDFPQRPKPPLP